MRCQWCIEAYPAFQKGDECRPAKRMDKPEPCLPAQRQENESRKRIPVRKGTEEHRGSPFARQPLHREGRVCLLYTSIRVTELATELASTFFGWYLSKHKKTR